MGIDHVHTCDSEFNIPGDHALEVCREIIRRGLGERLRWYAYCAPLPFTPELADLMRRAGCAGINFGADSGDDRMLGRLRTVMIDLLIGAPGETRESIVRTVEEMKKAEPDRVGVAVGVRVYPGTELAGLVAMRSGKEGLTGDRELAEPVFFLEPEVSPFVFDLLEDLTRGDDRFLFFDPARPEKNYNYNANRLLTEAIRSGFRGAYWDILRRIPRDPLR
jgi:hypothetical protein